MTMRTYRYFICPNNHKGVERTSENDQPYSEAWVSVTVENMRESGKDELGYTRYLCLTCEQNMKLEGK